MIRFKVNYEGKYGSTYKIGEKWVDRGIITHRFKLLKLRDKMDLCLVRWSKPRKN